MNFIILTPHSGNQLGGDLVSVQGPCFSDRDNVQCDFGGATAVAVIESDSVAHCVVPRLSQSGRVSFRLKINGEVRGESVFVACELQVG